MITSEEYVEPTRDSYVGKVLSLNKKLAKFEALAFKFRMVNTSAADLAKEVANRIVSILPTLALLAYAPAELQRDKVNMSRMKTNYKNWDAEFKLREAYALRELDRLGGQKR